MSVTPVPDHNVLHAIRFKRYAGLGRGGSDWMFTQNDEVRLERSNSLISALTHNRWGGNETGAQRELKTHF